MARARTFQPMTLALTAIVLCCGTSPARADDRVPNAATVVLDGVVEDAWESALRLATGSIRSPVIQTDPKAPFPKAPAAAAVVQPDLRVLASGGRLCFGLTCAEDPGSNIGLVVNVLKVSDKAKSGADALELGFRPQSVRAPRYVARGARGAGRTVYRVEGGAACRKAGTWSLELGVPLADIVGDDKNASLRVSALVLSRTPNVSATSPAASLFANLDDWHTLHPPEGGWQLDVEVDADRLKEEDEQDLARQKAWNTFASAAHQLFSAGAPRNEAMLRAALQEHLFEPLDAIVAVRPDLTPTIEYLRGDVHRQLGELDLARVAFEKAIAYAPGHREGWFGLNMVVRVSDLTEGAGNSPSDFDAAFRRIKDLAAEPGAGDPFAAHGRAFASALLTYKHGELDEALPLLKEIAEHYPHLRLAVTHYEACRDAVMDWARERQQRVKDAKASLPRMAIATNKGTFVVELFPEQAPNTVNNFVYLARKEFYDGLMWHHNVPFFSIQSGDPMSRDTENAKLVGGGGPGYAIRTEANARQPFRGALVMANNGRDTEGSQFFVATGTAVHLAKDYTVFGRVVEGMEVVDKLVVGDRIESVTPVRLTEGWDYHPITVGGEPASEPKDASPR